MLCLAFLVGVLRGVTYSIRRQDGDKAERIYRRWKPRLIVPKKSNGPGKLSGWIVCFREQNT